MKKSVIHETLLCVLCWSGHNRGWGVKKGAETREENRKQKQRQTTTKDTPRLQQNLMSLLEWPFVWNSPFKEAKDRERKWLILKKKKFKRKKKKNQIFFPWHVRLREAENKNCMRLLGKDAFHFDLSHVFSHYNILFADSLNNYYISFLCRSNILFSQ